jgi:catalase
VREVIDGDQRARLVSNVVGHVSDRVSEPVLERAFEYRRNVDKETGDLIAKGFNSG